MIDHIPYTVEPKETAVMTRSIYTPTLTDSEALAALRWQVKRRFQIRRMIRDFLWLAVALFFMGFYVYAALGSIGVSAA